MNTYCTCSPLSYPPSGLCNQVVYHLGSLPPGSSGSLTMTVQIDPSVVAGTSVTNVVQISGGESDSSLTNNSSSVSLVVQPATVDLAITASLAGCYYVCDSGSEPAGASVPFQVQLRNNGAIPANNVTITETVPSGTTFVSATMDGVPIASSLSGAQAVFRLGSLRPGGTATLNPTLKLSPSLAA